MSKFSTDTQNSTTDPLIARNKLESAATLHWFHWSIVSISFVLTLFAWYYSKSELEARIKAQFDREADQVIELVMERMSKYEDALRGAVALIHTSGGNIDYERWQQYAGKIHIQTTYPGINGIGVIHAVSSDALPAYLNQQQHQRPTFNIHPQRSGTLYLPISYIIPLEGNEKAVGLDIAHETNRFAGAIKARDSGQSQITGPITLVQDRAKMPGFLFYAPFYTGDEDNTTESRQDHFSGMVYAAFVVNKLMKGTLQKEKRNVGIRIRDGEEELYNELVSSEDDYDSEPMFMRDIKIQMYGRTWNFDIWSAESFRQKSADSQPLTILFGGLAIDSMLIMLFVSISRSSHRALAYADSMTHALKINSMALEAKAAELKKSNEHLSRFNEAARGRELRMVELKQEVNELLELTGHLRRYEASHTTNTDNPATDTQQPA